MAPVVHGLEAQWGHEINFVYLDIDDVRNDDFKRELGYQYQPHFFLLDGEGEIIQQWVGPVSEAEFGAVFEGVTQ
jgi:hypothetical protein